MCRTWGGGWVRTARLHVSQRRVLGSMVIGGDAVLSSIMGCTGRLGVGHGGRGSEIFQATMLKRCRKQHPRPLLPAPARVCSVRAPAPRPGRKRGEGRSLYLALTRRVPGPRLRFPHRVLLPSSPPPASTQIGPLVPGGASANSAGPRREAEPTPLPITTRFLSTDGALSQ